MITVSNERLSVHLLHPEHDNTRLGSRYCTGCYIYQVEHVEYGPLFSGPAYPDPTPPPFDGQGAPEAFTAPLGNADVSVGETITIIGVGEVLRSSPTTPIHPRQNPTVKQFCQWEIEQSPDTVTMITRQRHTPFHITLSRTVRLNGCTLISGTCLSNDSDRPLAVVWFPHPFFPLNTDFTCCRFHFDYHLPENPAYRTAENGTLCMKPEYNWKKGLFLKTVISKGSTFKADVMHPGCKKVTVTGDYPLATLPFWANANTFSPEPYMERELAKGQSAEWSIRYTFER